MSIRILTLATAAAITLEGSIVRRQVRLVKVRKATHQTRRGFPMRLIAFILSSAIALPPFRLPPPRQATHSEPQASAPPPALCTRVTRTAIPTAPRSGACIQAAKATGDYRRRSIGLYANAQMEADGPTERRIMKALIAALALVTLIASPTFARPAARASTQGEFVFPTDQQLCQSGRTDFCHGRGYPLWLWYSGA
jgi:hypothetical protein